MIEAAGPEAQIEDWLDQAAVMGVVEVLKHYSFFKEKLLTTVEEVVTLEPAFLLTIDYPGFNLRLAQRVKARRPGIVTKQFVCPQVWAWKKGRIPKIAASIDQLVCLFPFEPKLFENYDIDARFVGHPLVDELAAERVETSGRTENLVGLFPGSREREISSLLPSMLDAAVILAGEFEKAGFEIPAATPQLKSLIETMVSSQEKWSQLDLTVSDGGSRVLMQRAACGVIASGTATLEAACYGLPHCLVYRLAWATYLVAKAVVKIEHVGIINILGGREIVKELIQADADATAIASELRGFLSKPDRADNLSNELRSTAAQLGDTGASERVADLLLG